MSDSLLTADLFDVSYDKVSKPYESILNSLQDEKFHILKTTKELLEFGDFMDATGNLYQTYMDIIATSFESYRRRINEIDAFVDSFYGTDCQVLQYLT